MGYAKRASQQSAQGESEGILIPVSDPHGIPAIMNEVARLDPKTVLELGIGFGKWGVLLREILDARHGRCMRESWTAEIYGVEAFAPYQNPAWEVYNAVRVRDFAFGSIFPWKRELWDLVMMIDSLEHIPPECGRRLLRSLVEENDHLIISVPNGPMAQGEVYGNPHEAHLWTFNGTEEFEPYKYKVIHQSVCTVVSIEGEG